MPVPRYALWSSAAAPVLLIGGWTLAAALQRGGFDALHETISALAATDADHRWVMTLALLGVGVCHVVTARGLAPLARPARVMLGAGGVATVLVAAFPLPAGGRSAPHQAAATVAFACLALWPALWRPAGSGPVRPPVRVMVPAALVLAVLVLLFAVALGTGVLVGLAERLAAGAQAVWPLVTVLLLRRVTRR
ncbi:DUF998 domain-containing protein [Dactylosporangium sp. NPDC049140]|uniref:DUF998 domain-containing protein n=1 Tax=Dactylosporangium sp. NPDC049140 TaxID=3155647 RepID=UPI0033E7D5DA